MTSFKSKLGIGFVILGMILPVFGLFVPFFGLSSSLSATLIGFFMLGGPEIFLIVGGILAGKEGIVLVKNRVKGLLGLPKGVYPAPKSQYNLALILMVLWILAGFLPGYLPFLLDIPIIKENIVWISLCADVGLVLSIVFLGGHQMLTKITKLFTWEVWKLPTSD